MNDKPTSESIVRDIKRRTRKQYSSEEKIRIVIEGLRGETGIAELCRREGLNPNIYYKWSKEFLEAGKKRLAGNTARQASSGEVKDLRAEAAALKELVADLTLENRLFLVRRQQQHDAHTHGARRGGSRRPALREL